MRRSGEILNVQSALLVCKKEVSFHAQLCGLREIRSVASASSGVLGEVLVRQEKVGLRVTVGEETYERNRYWELRRSVERLGRISAVT